MFAITPRKPWVNLYINYFAEKERMNEKRPKFFCGRAVSNSADTTASINITNAMGSVQEYLVSPLYKQSECDCGRYTCVVCNLSNEASILESTQP